MKKYQAALIAEIYLAVSVAVAVLLLMETLKPGMVSAYLNLNYWLIVWVLGGILYAYRDDTPV